jgi:hypothetical protein
MHLLGQKRVIFACFFVCYYAGRDVFANYTGTIFTSFNK